MGRETKGKEKRSLQNENSVRIIMRGNLQKYIAQFQWRGKYRIAKNLTIVETNFLTTLIARRGTFIPFFFLKHLYVF